MKKFIFTYEYQKNKKPIIAKKIIKSKSINEAIEIFKKNNKNTKIIEYYNSYK